jgi:hypothetical protein
VLARARRDEDAEFHTRRHQTTHNIHYATARCDLMELHEKGYLNMELRGKAYVFTRVMLPRRAETRAAGASTPAELRFYGGPGRIRTFDLTVIRSGVLVEFAGLRISATRLPAVSLDLMRLLQVAH